MSLLVIALVQPTFALSEWTQERLEKRLWLEAVAPADDFVNFPEPECVPERDRDAIKDNQDFIAKGGWTTNQLINAFIQAVTNNISDEKWSQERNRDIAEMAVGCLSAINHPTAKLFVENVCTNNTRGMFGIAVSGIFRYTNFDPEVFEFMRRMCVLTNQYESCAGGIALDMERCLAEMPLASKGSATTNFAKYQYFVIHHSTCGAGIVDRQLARMISSYSNSVQRLRAMRHVANTATNAATAGWAQRQVQRLSALPTNELNNVSWLEE